MVASLAALWGPRRLQGSISYWSEDNDAFGSRFPLLLLNFVSRSLVSRKKKFRVMQPAEQVQQKTIESRHAIHSGV